MRVDPSYITNLVSSLDQTQANEQQLSAELSSGVSITSLSQNPVGVGRECAAAQPDSAGRFVHAKFEPGDGPVAGGGFGAGQRGDAS